MIPGSAVVLGKSFLVPQEKLKNSPAVACFPGMASRKRALAATPGFPGRICLGQLCHGQAPSGLGLASRSDIICGLGAGQISRNKPLPP